MDIFIWSDYFESYEERMMQINHWVKHGYADDAARLLTLEEPTKGNDKGVIDEESPTYQWPYF